MPTAKARGDITGISSRMPGPAIAQKPTQRHMPAKLGGYAATDPTQDPTQRTLRDGQVDRRTAAVLVDAIGGQSNRPSRRPFDAATTWRQSALIGEQKAALVLDAAAVGSLTGTSHVYFVIGAAGAWCVAGSTRNRCAMRSRSSPARHRQQHRGRAAGQVRSTAT